MKLKTKLKLNKLFFIASVLLVFSFAISVEAATIYPSPSSGSFDIGDSFSVVVFVESDDQAMNAVSGVLDFPSDKLEVTSVSKSNSVVNLWIQEPSFSNTAGTVNFEGIVLNPGYIGSAGRVITINFRTKVPGNADITFISGFVLANNGQGTSILHSLGSASFVIDVPVTGPVAADATTPTSVVIAGTLVAPVINSSTHPDPDAWYSIITPSFNWNLPKGATANRLLVGEKPQANPTVVYIPAISEKTLDEFEDGVWYFHAQLKNSNGWGGVSHFRFQIDTQKPEIFILEKQPESDLTNPSRKFLFMAEDNGSGISHYEIQIDGGDIVEWTNNSNGIYTTPVLGFGKHTIIVKALDRAGNYLTAFSDFTIEALEEIEILHYPEELTNKDKLEVSGKTYPNAQVIFWLQKGLSKPQSYNINADVIGEFSFVSDEELEDGMYQIWTEVTDHRGAKSASTNKYKIIVQPTKLIQIGNITISILSIVIPVLALIFLFIFMVWYFWHKLHVLRLRVRRETDETQSVLHKEFGLFKRRLKSHVSMIEKTGKKRTLTKEESNLVTRLKKDLDQVEEKIQKEITDIKKEVK